MNPSFARLRVVGGRVLGPPRTWTATTTVVSRSASTVLDEAARYAVLRERLLALDTTVLCDADKANTAAHPTGLNTLQVIDSAIHPLNPDAVSAQRMVGRARTVAPRGEEFLTVLHALAHAEAGDVLMIAGGGAKRAKCGGIFGGYLDEAAPAGATVFPFPRPPTKV